MPAEEFLMSFFDLNGDTQILEQALRNYYGRRRHKEFKMRLKKMSVNQLHPLNDDDKHLLCICWRHIQAHLHTKMPLNATYCHAPIYCPHTINANGGIKIANQKKGGNKKNHRISKKISGTSENSLNSLREFPRLHRGNLCLLDLINVATGLQMKNRGNVLLFISRYDWNSAPYAAENNYCYQVRSLTSSIRPVIFTTIIIRRKWHKVRCRGSKSEKKLARQRVVTYQYTYIQTSTPTASSTAAKNSKVFIKQY